jgi:hypothetical protein
MRKIAKYIFQAVACIAAGIVVVVFLIALLPLGFTAAVIIGDVTGWYRMEDQMCTITQGCDEYIAERKRLRENRTPENSN